MALLNDEEDKSKLGQQGGGGAYLGGGSGIGATTGIKSETPTSSGSYSNIQNYLTANEGNDTAMGQAAGSVVGASGGQARQDIGTMQGNATKAVDAGTKKVDAGIQGQINSWRPGNADQTIADLAAGNTTGYQNAVYGGPASVDTSYGGPNSYNEVAGMGDVEKSTGNTKSLADSAKTTGGVSNLLKSAYSQPGYNSGENTLDTFLTQAGKGGQEQLNKIGSDWGGIKNEAQNAYGGIQSQIQGGKDTSAATGKQYASDIANAQAGVGALNSQFAGARATGAAVIQKRADDAAAAIAAENKRKADAAAAAKQAAATPTPDSSTIPFDEGDGTGKGVDYSKGDIPTLVNTQINTLKKGWGAHGGKVPEKKYQGIHSMLRGR